ncbi:MAG: amidohydrolase family protein [Isosphaeraceae bacterium]
MPMRADAHIHLFAGGYRGGSFASRPGVSIDESACYDSLAREHDVAAALVVGYGAEDWCIDNNSHILEQRSRFDWARPLAYLALDNAGADRDVELLPERGFVGVSMYVFGDDSQRLSQLPVGLWRWLEERDWVLSVNSQGAAWAAWQPILEQFPRLRLLISHLGLPPAVASPPSREQASYAMQQVTDLSIYPGVRVKLSGFYALTSPGHDFPHQAAWPYVEQLVEAFSCDRLLWASDFSPCLDWVSFPQTIDIVNKMPFLSEDDVAKISGGNLLALLR